MTKRTVPVVTKLKKPLLFALCLLPIAAIAGVFVSLYQLDVYSEEIVAQIMAEIGSRGALAAVGAAQSMGYALICGFFGYILADKLGLWKPVRLEKKKLLVTLTVSVVGGVVFSLDHWVFGSMLDGIQEANAAGLTLSGVLASVLYGGVIEEVLLRLFVMSLIAWIIRMVFCRKAAKEEIPEWVFVSANVLAAALFAAGHLPATSVTFGALTPILLFRCFLLNGGFGLIFGRLYRKYGIIYAMVAHALFHVVCKSVWMAFI